MEKISRYDFFDSFEAGAKARRMPEGISFELTYGCNLRCAHCYNPTHQAKPNELKTPEVFSLLEQMLDLGVLHIDFTGGELFTRPDLFQILEKAEGLGYVMTLISNATRITQEIADRLRAIRLLDVALSIYGATKETYEAVTGVAGSYDRFISGLKLLSSRKIIGSVRMPVMTINRHEVQAARTLVESLGFGFKYSLDIWPRMTGDLAPLNYRLNPEEKVAVKESVTGFTEHDIFNDPSCFANFLECACGQTRFAITPYGEMNLCASFPEPRFDLRKGNVKEGWKLLKKFADGLRPNEHYECPACGVRAYCRQGRNDAYLETGDLSRCLPHYKTLASLEKIKYEALAR